MANVTKLDVEIKAAGIAIDGVRIVSGNPVVDFQASATQQNKDDATTIIAAHDDTLKLGAINAKTTGAKLIAIVGQNNAIWLPLMYRIYLRAPGGVTTPAQISIGTNSPNYDNIQSSVTLTGWINNDTQNFFISTRRQAVLSPLGVYVRVITAATAPGVYTIFAEFLGETKEL